MKVIKKFAIELQVYDKLKFELEREDFFDQIVSEFINGKNINDLFAKIKLKTSLSKYKETEIKMSLKSFKCLKDASSKINCSLNVLVNELLINIP